MSKAEGMTYINTEKLCMDYDMPKLCFLPIAFLYFFCLFIICINICIRLTLLLSTAIHMESSLRSTSHSGSAELSCLQCGLIAVWRGVLSRCFNFGHRQMASLTLSLSCSLCGLKAEHHYLSGSLQVDVLSKRITQPHPLSLYVFPIVLAM